ncbi:MAG: hypothetical protein NTW28_09520 [Candidatus Solibacter sp.]|nr:hypothetical protein [Candidatus Solibacter sp.]
MPGIAPTGGPCTAKITIALNQSGVTEAHLQSDAGKAILSLQLQAKSTLENLNLNSSAGSAASGGASATPGAFSALGTDMSAWNSKFDKMGEMGAALDSMESQAQDLMKSPKKEDQLKGQQMMQAVTQIMEALIKAIQSMGDAAKHAIDASQSH